MIIQHNIPALNSHRNLLINNSGISKNLEKLSSGFRINRAADDAAGLAISEKMRGQIRGLAMAEQNVSHGINLIQTAEGALNETHAILQRMRELAVQSSNGTYQDEDRAQIAKEYEAIKSEVDRIAESTHYNNIKLLDGSLGGGGSVGKGFPNIRAIASDGSVTNMSTTAGDDIVIVEGTKSSVTFGGAGTNVGIGDTIKLSYLENGVTKSFSHTLTKDDFNVVNAGKDLKEAMKAHFDISKFDIDYSDTTGVGQIFSGLSAGDTELASFDFSKIKIDARENGLDTIVGLDAGVIKASDGKYTTTGATTPTSSGSNARVDIADLSILAGGGVLEIDGKLFQVVSDPNKLTNPKAIAIVVNDASAPEDDEAAIITQLQLNGVDARALTGGGISFFSKQSGSTGGGNALIFQIGANGTKDQRVSLSIDNMNAASLGIKNTNVADRDTANAAIDIVNASIIQVAGTRADLGALQNRLEHTLNSLGVSKENLTAAESTIRDVDMAKEMMEFTKNNILVQASQAMLAQANQLPQGVLSLLR